MVKLLWVMAGIGLVGAACTDQQAVREKESERMYYVTSRDLEQELETLPKAIEGYREVAERYPDMPAGKRAHVRQQKLLEVQSVLAGLETVTGDSVIVLYRQANSAAPDYPPVLRKLGKLYSDNLYFLTRTASKVGHNKMASNVLKMWTRQDSLWSAYTFQPLPVDREWRDRLCKQAVDVARMLGKLKRYDEALAVVTRGIQYAVSEDVIARAQVFASYYTFWTSQFEEAIDLAETALSYEHLSDENKARAYHVIGLGYTYVHQDSNELSDLDAAIQALNTSVGINPSNKEAKKLLKTLRLQRQKLAPSA